MKKKKDFVELKCDCYLKNIRNVIKDSKDHRVSFYHGFLNKITKTRIHNKSKEMIKTLSELESWQNDPGVLRPLLSHA